MLGNEAIKKALKDGRIEIDPFDEEQLGPNSYDLRIGEWVCRQREFNPIRELSPQFNVSQRTVELINPVDGLALWNSPYEVQSGIIRLHPGELILAHTREFVGCYEDVVGEMASRSTLMRMGIAICVDAGLGDVGFASKWTMEVYNHTRAIIDIHVGDRVAQMKFHEVKGVSKNYQDKGGVYGVPTGEWDPNDMIPRSSMS